MPSETVKKAKKSAAKKLADKKLAQTIVKDTHMGGFINFIREQGVVGLAVGLAIGTAAGDTVKKLVTAFIDPLVRKKACRRHRLPSKLPGVRVNFCMGRLLAR